MSRHFLDDLGATCTVIRFDERGYGLSDWEIGECSLQARVTDLEAVVESVGLGRFALLGMSQGGPVAISYAVRHPDRVTRLVLFGTWAALGRTAADRELLETFLSMTRVGWARPDSLFRRVFTNMLIPGASEEQMRWVDALQRMSTSTANAVRLRAERHKIDITGLLSQVTVPTLVLHSRGDAMVSFEEARLMASSIPGPGWCRWRARTTSCWRASPRGACFCMRWPPLSSRIAPFRQLRSAARRWPA